MDTITHSITGALIGYALGSNKTDSKNYLPAKERVFCGAIVAAFPDIDYVTALFDPLLFITYWHRGITHSLVMLPVWAIILGGLLAYLLKKRAQWKSFVMISIVVLASHILLDVITSWDVQLLAPLSDFRVSLRYVFVIDPIFTSIVFIALILSVYRGARWLSFAGLGTLTLYVAGLSLLQLSAMNVAHAAAETNDWQAKEITVLPQPFSPFHWKLIVSDDLGHWLAFVNLASDDDNSDSHEPGNNIFSLLKHYRSQHTLNWRYFPGFKKNNESLTVWNHPNFYLFRKFAHYPAVSNIKLPGSNLCIWFLDLRFYVPVLDTPFQYGMCKNSENNWTLYRIRNFSDQTIQQPVYSRSNIKNSKS